MALAGVYPPGMKLVASWSERDRGLAIGLLVGALTVASLAEHGTVRRALGALGLAAGVLLLVLLLFFALDAMEMRARVVPEGRTSFLVSTLVAALKIAGGVLVALATAWAGLRRRGGGEPQRRSASEKPTDVVRAS